MNKKVLSLLAASAAVVGSAIFATPARAVQQEVEVNLTVDQVLFLRTFRSIDLKVSQGELSEGAAVDKDFVQANDGSTDGTALIDVETPTGVNNIEPGQTVTKEVKELYAVWSNGDDVDDGDVTVTITTSPDGDTLSTGGRRPTLAKMTVGDMINSDRDIGDINDELDRDDDELLRIGGVFLNFQFTDDEGEGTVPLAGEYTGGSLIVEATTIGGD
jgi:hypothetical protein